MKKILLSLLTIVMCFLLVGCGNENKPNNDKGNTENKKEQKENNENKADPKEDILKKVGLELSKIEPDEEFYIVDFDDVDDGFTFYMEKGTEKNVGEYVHKIYNACKNIASDGKIYQATFSFYMKDSTTPELELESKETINGYGFYIGQFGYLYNGNTVTITIGSLTDYDEVRNDDLDYPIYTFDINV